MDFTKRDGDPVTMESKDLDYHGLDSERVGVHRTFLQKNDYETRDGLLPFGEPT